MRVRARLGARRAPTTSSLLNDAFAVDPLVVDVAPRRGLDDPVVVVHVIGGRRRRCGVPPDLRAQRRRVDGRGDRDRRRCRRRPPGRSPSGAVDCRSDRRRRSSEHLVVPVTEIRVGDDATLAYVSVQSLGPDTWQLAHQASTIGANATLAQLRRGAGRRLRPPPDRLGVAGRVGVQPAPGRLHRPGRSDARLPDPAGPPRPAHHQRPAVHGGGGRPFPLRVQRPDPGPAGGGASDAMQTNHNLVLDEGAHADSVPNLDIEENDVNAATAQRSDRSTRTSATTWSPAGVEPERGRAVDRGRVLRRHRRTGARCRHAVDDRSGPGRPGRSLRCAEDTRPARRGPEGQGVRSGRPVRR